MSTNLDFPGLLRLIDERSAAFRAVVAAAPGLDLPVPSCPGWTLADLAQHIGTGRHRWAATVAAGPADAPPDRALWNTSDAPTDRADLLAWLAEASERLREALLTAGPDAGCWAWWDPFQSPLTSGTVARHQLQEMTVHTYDAQLAVGAVEPLPVEVAIEGVDEFLTTCVATTIPWPHDPAVVDYRTVEGPSWRVHLSADGARIDRAPAAAGVTVLGTAGELILLFYGRTGLDTLKVDGDGGIIDRLAAWEPE
ncbi:hypothetical protein Aph02nite_30430 [Actinoplanes philippinensis]|uniref:TIGR03083 family protein n=1 Tax=Actinoplanes philippinensis TaxID=35752 RepID=A0A1I2EDQ1_9ACTN|nr:maleylpyruvate isomerase family mycothiol-dependent enzyme [Actinoplanes philippinensis]GIE77093.1 hypothetical protein Aph02nite_30430 [Actinoplanes philippinensis]SFE90601.1 TIGR03083 family protein [Actinoplanes philippinensis]